ncbi:hypothetical protein METBIDRAFT_82300 [Metschnikowia bicuspidata var. bicuspidata NRRL YB-4993]|uniref:Uncharacterized protein n=1 Tax=Metschnikowia bicuspidata var. bicuspidata NRRL YB-4993 TaxID=869754 RepID=A0A1A0HEA4_9ASCO|nr:hypothetical protein METBIDRAFT_82300 [Metschnikowia bicuspidata var. bicuspidata NRRL YB-4993]OBA22320.1 hypothetical protein METBIDRAFT_82300 [Metschnikowia bicuspidata var. bicuspidata NRRL YB-4993]
MMTALVSASSHYSDGSEFAMSELSMLDFVRDLNGQSDNRLTVNQLPFDTEASILQVKERSLSPEIDLVPSYLLTPSSQLVPTASSSLFNYRTGGNFRKKLCSLGNTLFSKTPPSASPRELCADLERSAANSPLQSTKEEASSVPAKRGFVFPGRGNPASRKTKKELLDKAEEKQEHTWLSFGSSLDSNTQAPKPALQSLFSLSNSDPSLSADLKELALEPTAQKAQNATPTKNASPVRELIQSEEALSKKSPPKSSTILDEGTVGSKAYLTKPAPNTESENHKEPTLHNSGPMPDQLPSPPVLKKENIEVFKTHSQQQQQTPTEKHKNKKEKVLAITKVDSTSNKIKERAKSTNAAQNTSKGHVEKRNSENQKEAVANTDAEKAQARKNEKKHSNLHTLVTIDNSPASVKLPRGKLPVATINAKINAPRTQLTNKDHTNDSHVPLYDHKTEPVHPKKASKKVNKEECVKSVPDQKYLQEHSTVIGDDKPYDREAELQFSPFVVSGLTHQTRLVDSTSKAPTQKGGTAKREALKNPTDSAHGRTSTFTLFPLWAKFPQTFRSSKFGLSPMHRLTTLFTGTEAQTHSNAASLDAAFLPREAEKSWQENPTVQSLGDFFAKPPNTSKFDQTGSWSQPGEPYALSQFRSADTHRWRNKFRFGFRSAKESKVTKPKASSIQKERKTTAREKRPKSILKSAGQQGEVFIPVLGEPGPVLAAARTQKRQLGLNQRKRSGTKKA